MADRKCCSVGCSGNQEPLVIAPSDLKAVEIIQ